MTRLPLACLSDCQQWKTASLGCNLAAGGVAVGSLSVISLAHTERLVCLLLLWLQ